MFESCASDTGIGWVRRFRPFFLHKRQDNISAKKNEKAPSSLNGASPTIQSDVAATCAHGPHPSIQANNNMLKR